MKNEKWEIFTHEYMASLFPISMLADSIAMYGTDLAFKIENGNVEYYNISSNWQVSHARIVNNIKKDANFLADIFNKTEIVGKLQIKDVKKFKFLNWKKVPISNLINFYNHYIRTNLEVYELGLVLPLLDYQKETFLTDEIHKFLKTKKADKYFNILTTPLRDTANKQQELALLKILFTIKRINKLYSLFKEFDSDYLIDEIRKNYKSVWKKILKHTNKYAWVYFLYEGPAADPRYFVDILKDFVKRGVDPEKELINHAKEKLNLKNQQEKIINALKPNRYYKNIIKLGREAVFYKPYRRELQSCSYYYMEFLFIEIARRLNVSLRQVRMMLPKEILVALQKNKIDTDEINKRLKFLIYKQQHDKSTILTGEAAKRFLKNVKKEKLITDVNKIKGSTAYPGKATGTVRVINSPSEMNKMKSGDILVSAATSPNLMPAIRQAAAIVTDEGGLTAHAAIVSRELKIPCVVGTKIATKVLKDGDLVEVDAEKGVVKIIKRKKNA